MIHRKNYFGMRDIVTIRVVEDGARSFVANALASAYAAALVALLPFSTRKGFDA
jgi:hypothetical protein